MGAGASLLSSLLAAIALTIFGSPWVPIQQNLYKRIRIPAGIAWAGLIAVLVANASESLTWLPTWVAFALLVLLTWPTPDTTSESSPTEATRVADSPPPASNRSTDVIIEPTAPIPTLPRWLSEFIDTHGSPTHLRTSRNYIEVCGKGHSSYVRISLASASEQIPREIGLRIHKEYYVMRSAVRGHERDGGRHLLVLGDDLKLPVGRSFLSSVKEAGLLG